ncbi:MAG: protein kinase family protein [Candidatus Berkiella sp.]
MRNIFKRKQPVHVATQVSTAPQYEAFIKRIIIAYCHYFRSWGLPMSRYLTQREMLNIFSYVTEDHQVIRELNPRQSIRIAKNTQGFLPRTIEILRDHTGEFQLIINTRSKTALRGRHGKPIKRHLAKIGGSYKKYKPSWRVDTYPATLKANLIFHLSPDLILRHWECEDIEREMVLSQQCADSSPYICAYEVGARYTSLDRNHNPIYKISCYAENFSMNLHDLILRERLSDQQLDRLRLDILEGVATLHKKNIIHQDIKADNILVYQDKNHQWRAKIIDFGLSASTMNPYEKVHSSGYYQSPEIAYFHSDKHDLDNWHFYHIRYYNSYGNKFKPRGVPQDYAKPNKANDMWALGILFYVMDKKCYPREMSDIQDPLIKRLLVVNRISRISIQEAIRLQYALLRPKHPAPKPILNAFDMRDLRTQIEKVWCESPSAADHNAHSGDLLKLISCF